MSDDRDRYMMTSHLEKRLGTPHSASPPHALQHARLLDTLPCLISPSLLTILVPSTGREPPDQQLQEQCWRQSRDSSKPHARRPHKEHGRHAHHLTFCFFPTGTLTTRTRMFQKGLSPELGKSPNEKTKPVITYSNTLTNTLTSLIPVSP